MYRCVNRGFKTNRVQIKVSISDTVSTLEKVKTLLQAKNYYHSESELESDSNSTSINPGIFIFFISYCIPLNKLVDNSSFPFS